MKRLQKFFYVILLFSGIAMSCSQGTSSGGGNDPGSDGWEKKVSLSVLDETNQSVTLTESGNKFSTTVKTQKATVSVSGIPLGAKVEIDNAVTRSTELSFTANGEQKTVKVAVTYKSDTLNYEVTVRYYKGAIENVVVTDESNKSVSANSPDAFSYLASVGTKKATVTVKTFDPADIVKIGGEETKTKAVEFGSDNKAITLSVTVKHGDTEEPYTVTILYSDPNAVPKEAVLKSITVRNANNESEDFPLSPQFHKYNQTYNISLPNSVNKIKVEAEAEAGIDVVIDGGAEHELAEGNNVVKVKAVQTGKTENAYEYTINVQKASAAASGNAFLASLELATKWGGLDKAWITPPAAFDKGTDTYTGKMDAHCDEFFITAAPENAHAVMTVKANGAFPVPLEPGIAQKFATQSGMNTFVITVTAENASSVKTYTIYAERNVAGSCILKTLTVSGIPDFYSESYEKYKKGETASKLFRVDVPGNKIPVTVTAEPEFPDTTTMEIKINGKEPATPFNGTQVVDFTDLYEFAGKKTDEVHLEITLHSTVTSVFDNIYRLNLCKVSSTGDSDNTLSDLTVQYYGNGYKFYAAPLNETFSSTKTDYTLTLPYGTEEIRVTATPNSSKASINNWLGGTTNSFYAPFTKVTIPVVAENGDRKDYTITVSPMLQTTVTIGNITENQTIDLAAHQAGLVVSGTFTNPSLSVDSIWVGSSGLPIQEKNGGKWVQAQIQPGDKFTAVLPLEALKDLPNGLRDIKAGAFKNIGGTDVAVAIARVPVIVTGNSAATAPFAVRVKKAVTESIPSDAVMSIIVLDSELWRKGEDIVYASTVTPIGSLHFPTEISLAGVKAGVDCRVEVYIFEKDHNNKDVLKYYDIKMDVPVNAGQSNKCEVELKSAN